MLGLKEATFKLECIVYNLIPEVYIFLLQHQITFDYFVSQWFITMFQYDIDHHEQCMTIVLLALFFGQKVIFQIAFQMINEIKTKLVNYSFEDALIYLKDFASEIRFTKVNFLMRALENDLITNELVTELSYVYERFRIIYKGRDMNGMMDSSMPVSQRVRFLRSSIPGKVNIKVLWQE